MTPATAGWIVLGVFSAAALVLMLAGVLHVVRAQRDLKIALMRLEETQRRVIDSERLNVALARISRDAEQAKDLIERARGAAATIAVALRYCAVALRIVRMLT
jgi:hypothetical protein